MQLYGEIFSIQSAAQQESVCLSVCYPHQKENKGIFERETKGIFEGENKGILERERIKAF